MPSTDRDQDWIVRRGAELLRILPFYCYVLVVNGAILGIMTPTLGQSVWLTGFAKSIADAPTFSIFATTIGIPEPAAIAFGLPGALVIVVGLKLGLTPPDSYTLACLFWLAIAFWGAFSLGRHFGASILLGAIGTTVWLTFPIVWQHSGYSMLSMGIALLPTYLFSALVFLEKNKIKNISLLVLFSITASFMDGYTFVMFASVSFAMIAHRVVILRKFSLEDVVKYLSVVMIFVISYYLYSCYSPSGDFTYDLDFFRGWGVDISFLLFPTQGLLWFPDLIGLSNVRVPDGYYGDSSVYRTTFSLIPITFALLALVSPYGNRELKLTLFLVGMIALYLALGPSFKYNALRPEGSPSTMLPEYALGPTGTAFLWEHIPGLYSMRAVYRWTALALLGFWAVIMMAVSDSKLPRACAYLVLALLTVYNTPHLERLTNQYARDRSSFLQMEADLDNALRDHLRPGERMAVLPAGNDFLMNFLGPHLGVETYNIGGDKNSAIAQAAWPDEIRRASNAALSAQNEFPELALTVLHDLADVIAVPYMNLLIAAHHWPYHPDRYDAMQSNVAALRATGFFEIVETEYFALVRLNEEMAALSREDRGRILAARACPVGPGGRVSLAPGKILAFSQSSNLCGIGWSGVEAWGRWSDGERAELRFDLATRASGQVLEFEARSYVSGHPPRQSIQMAVNGEPRPEWVFTRESATRVVRLDIPEGAEELVIKFSFPDARSPRDVAGGTEDTRTLGLGLTAVCLTGASVRCLTQP